MPGKDGDEVDGAVPVTQLGRVMARHNGRWARQNFSFRCGLRAGDEKAGAEDEDYISLLEGRVSVEEAVPLVNRGDDAGGADGTRHTLASSLQKAGFRVVFRPLPTIPGHIAVYWEGEWDDDVADQFNRCFTEYERGPDATSE